MVASQDNKQQGETMKTFNTGREYAAEGQIINYQVIDTSYGQDEWCADYLDYTVLFNDVTRGIDGYVEFTAHKDDNATTSIQSRIMDKYDTGKYEITNDIVK